MQKYSARFRSYRKAMQPYIGSESAVAQFNHLQEVETYRFLFRVLEDPTKLIEHIQTWADLPIISFNAKTLNLMFSQGGWRDHS